MSLFKEKLELKAEEAEFKAQKIMSRFEAWQKWLIFIFLIGGILGYFIAKAIAGSYYQKQYQQYLIQAKPSFTNPEPIQIERIDIASYGENEFAVAALLKNKNLDLGAKNVPYTMKFLAADGSETAPAVQSQFYILPNQAKYLLAPRVASEAGIASVDVSLDAEPAWQKKTDLPEVKLIASQPKGFDQTSPFGYVLEGSVANSSAYQIKEIKLTFLLYGTGGKIIGASQRSEFDFKPFERRDYKQIWAGISGRNVVRAETIAETNLLEKENLTAPEINGENGAGDLGR